MKKALTMAVLAIQTLACHADGYPYLVVEGTDGTTHSLPTSGLTLTFSGGQLVSSDGTTLPLSTLSKMYFSQTAGICEIQLRDAATGIYDSAGIRVGKPGDLRKLPKGLYVIKNSDGTIRKTIVE